MGNNVFFCCVVCGTEVNHAEFSNCWHEIVFYDKTEDFIMESISKKQKHYFVEHLSPNEIFGIGNINMAK